MTTTYKDVLYGSWQLPEIVARLIQTQPMKRAAGITMDTVPNVFLSSSPICSRFDHGLGVAYLAQQVIEQNPQLDVVAQNYLLAASLLHDAGNPPFAHLSEYFLKQVCQHNGESFLECILDSETRVVLKEFGLDCHVLLDYVCGKTTQASILHGSMDLDNLDNIARHAYYTGLEGPSYNPVHIARKFRWHDNKWVLESKPKNYFQPIRQWQSARKNVYSYLYDEPHLGLAMMLWRVLDIAYSNNYLDSAFFFLTDNEAIAKLNKLACTAILMSYLSNRHTYPCVYNYTNYSTTILLDNLRIQADDHRFRQYHTDRLASELRLDSPQFICMYLGKSREYRKVTVPCRVDKTLHYDQTKIADVYPIRVYLKPGCDSVKARRTIKDYVEATNILGLSIA